MKNKIVKKTGNILKLIGLFLWENKRNIGILASQFILPAINSYFPSVMTPDQYAIWLKGAGWLAVGGVVHNTAKNGKKRIQKQNAERI